VKSIAGLMAGLFSVVGVSSVDAAARDLCNAGEAVIFSCPSGSDTISVCATRDFSATQGLLLYRFGRSLSSAFSLAAAPAGVKPAEGGTRDDNAQVNARTLTFAGGGGAYLRFAKTNDAYAYIVFTAIGRGWGKKQGVAVTNDGKTVSYRRCTAEPVSEIGPAFFERARIPEDDKEFLLPGR
jgi:hypothetical protein